MFVNSRLILEIPPLKTYLRTLLVYLSLLQHVGSNYESNNYNNRTTKITQPK